MKNCLFLVKLYKQGTKPSSEFIYIGQKIKYGEFSLICVFWQICDVSRGKIPA